MTKKQRVWLVLGVGGIAVIAGFVALGLSEQSEGQRRLSAARAAARRQDIPLTSEEFSQHWPPVPENQNAWTLYAEAIEIVRDPTAPPDGPFRSTPALRDYVAIIRNWRRGDRWWHERGGGESAQPITEVSRVLDRLERAQAMPGLHLDKPWEHGLSVEYPELGQLIYLERIASTYALLALRKGDRAEGVRGLRLGAGLAMRMASIPTLSAQFSAMQMAFYSQAIVKWALCSGLVPTSEVRELRRIVEPLMKAPDLRAAFRSFTYFGVASLELAESEERMLEAGFTDRDVRRSRHKEGLKEETETKWLEAAAAALKAWPEDSGDVDGLVRATEEPAKAMHEALILFNRTFRDWFAQSQPLNEAAADLMRLHVARSRVLQVLLNLLEAGEHPQSLPDLPKDPYSGKPLIYRKTSNGFVVYSVGANGEDDGGVPLRVDGVPRDLVIAYPDDTPGW
jgi:hypothetical protein